MTLKIDQQADSQVGEAQVPHHQRHVGRQQAFDGLELDEDPVVDDEIESIAAVQTQPLVLDRKHLLASDAYPAQRELSAHTRFVGGLEQAGT